MIKLVFIGKDFYWESGTLMSSIYTEEGVRSDWGKVECALGEGEEISIRQATAKEKSAAYEQLRKIRKSRDV